VPANSFGERFRITTFGESHGPALGVVIDGCPPGLPLSEEDLLPDLARRRPGQSHLTTQRSESDQPDILSGIFEGETTGAPICILFRSDDTRSRDYEALKDVYRPGHADHTWDQKFGRRDHRGGGRASARETVARVAAGAVARKLLAREAIEVVGYTLQVGDIVAPSIDRDTVTVVEVDATPIRCPDPDTAAAMEALVLEVRKDGDSIGGIGEFVVRGCPAGLGEPVFDKLKADLAKALLSIPAVVGFEYGSGFAAARRRGSEHNDTPTASEGEIRARTNRHGGMLGGISSGESIVMRACVKPTSSIATEQSTVTRSGEETKVKVTGRHDPCLVPRFIPIGEAMIVLVLLDHLMRWRAQTSLR
jgi:chorismate synthase